MAHQRERLFAGFLLIGHWGICPYPTPDQTLLESWGRTDDGFFAGSSQINDRGDVPILLLCSESETKHNALVRQPDTATFRFWEMAGTAHAAGAGFDLMSGVAAGVATNELEWQYVGDAALRHLVRWIDDGRPPPTFPPIEVVGGRTTRDEFGNAVGGIRLPDFAAATARHSGTNASSPIAALLGESQPFSSDVLLKRYPTRDAYLDTWNDAVEALIGAGLDVDRETLVARGEARASQLDVW